MEQAKDPVAQHATDKMAEILKEKAEREKAAKEAEARDAASGDGNHEEQKTKELEEQAKRDEEILGKEDSDLNDDEKARKEQLTSKKTEKMEKKVEARKDEIQQEIDSLIAKKKSLEGEVKSLEETKNLNSRIETLEKEREQLKSQEDQKSQQEALKQKEQDRIAKYLEEDQDKPREERREMSKEDLDEWYLEDPTAATEWINERSLRRADERKADKQQPSTPNEKAVESYRKLVAKYPKVDVKARGAELKAQGKSDTEIMSALKQENEHFRLMMEIVDSNPSLYGADNGPELVMAEMDKRLSSNQDGKKTYTEEEVAKIKEDAARLERERLDRLDEAPSSGGREKVVSQGKEYEEGLNAFIKAGKMRGKNWTKKDYDKMIARRKTIVGVNDPELDKKGF